MAKVDDTVECTGYLVIDGRQRKEGRCWVASKFGHLLSNVAHHPTPYTAPHPTGFLNLADGIERSCNVYFETMADRMKMDLLGEWMGKFGLGHVTGLGIPEFAGRIPGQVQVPNMRSATWFSGIGQSQVNSKIELTFAKALRAILRQDPDVIMIGEIRDLETAQIAVQASLTGHLVLATLHTNDSAAAVTRLLDMGIEPFLLSSSLLGVVAQRLVRKLCEQCKQFDGKQWHAVGCDHCGQTGYQGRVGVYELLLTTDAIREQIHNQASEAEIRNAALRNGMKTMREDGERWLAAGVTTQAELLRVTKE